MSQPFFNPQQLNDETDKMITREILNFKGNRVADNEDNELFAKTLEVNGYLFLKITVIGALNIRLKNACKVRFSGYFTAFTIASDDESIQTSYSTRLNKGITRFDVLMDEDAMGFIRKESLITLTILVPSQKGIWKVKHEEIPCTFVLDDPEAFRAMFKP